MSWTPEYVRTIAYKESGIMPTQKTTPSQIIVLSGRAAGAPGSKMATISLVDEAGRLLDRACINDDGSCELSKEALASAHGVLFEPVNVLIEADRFRQMIETERPVDVTELLAATGQHVRSSCPPQDHDHDKFHTGGLANSQADPIGM
jgi:hypothetical protein